LKVRRTFQGRGPTALVGVRYPRIHKPWPRRASLAEVVPLAAQASDTTARRIYQHRLAGTEGSRARHSPPTRDSVQQLFAESLRIAEQPLPFSCRDIDRIV